MVGLVGEDETGRLIRRQLDELQCDTGGLIPTPQRCSTCKVRFVGLAQHRHPQHLMRLDFEDASPIEAELVEQVLQRLEQALDGAEALCLEDYNKGLLTEEVCRRAIAAARRRGLPVFVDPYAREDYARYAGATSITPNRHETMMATGINCRTEEDHRQAAETLLEKLELEAVILTLDKDGAYLATRDGERRWVRTRPRNVYDVAGAGDMLLAMLATARLGGAGWAQATALCNMASGLEIEKYGSAPITRQEIVQELLVEAGQRQGKQRSLDRLMGELSRHRAAGKRIVFTNGCFDLIHLGHIKYFQFAKAQGDLLVVGVNTDRSIRRLKGPKRPIINETDRLSVLEELESIDYLILFDEPTPLDLIERISPEVLVKGADYTKEQVVGWEWVEQHGGRVALAPLVDGRSTSAVIQRILEAYGGASVDKSNEG
jgi:D-beta-D-heptose 7-phosphate kinase/D-beta-D-heptose 1-phosphate adenosyltransferase